ncbi:MAG: uracil-DNA glycosylase [Balneolaceae bacterium]
MISNFIQSLNSQPAGPLFNPWYDRDCEHDDSPGAPEIRRLQFQSYLQERIGRAKYLLIAEALGYQGGHFTGIAMTSERILLGHQEDKYGVKPVHVFKEREPIRTSKVEVNRKGMSEPTATIMWGALIGLGIDPYEVVLWNAVPWHPYDPDSKRGILSNRTPVQKEMEAGLTLLRRFLELFEGAKPIAVGRKCEQSLSELGIDHEQVRHPANGGAPKFRKQLKEIVPPSRGELTNR